MKMSRFVAAVVIAASVTSAFAALSPQNSEWGKSAVQFLMTKEETAQWKNIKTDADAEKFIALFWAKRDPSPATPANEYRTEFDARVQYADDKFTAARRKGSTSDRGKVLILFGSPTRVERSAERQQPMNSDPSNQDLAPGNEATQTWIYEGDVSQKAFGIGRADIKFVDRVGNQDFKLDRNRIDVNSAGQKAVLAAITQPALTEVPQYGQAAATRPAAPAAATTPAPAAAPAVARTAETLTAFKTPAYQTAVTDFKAAKKSPYTKPIYATWGENVTAQGQYFVPLSIYVPKSAGITASQNLTFFGAIEDANGNPVAVFEEPAKLVESKGDFYLDKSVTLPAGKLRGTFGFAENGTPVSMVTTDMELAGSIDNTAAGVSKLILANNIYPMEKAQEPTEPFAYGGLKVVPKSDRTFTTQEELWYFINVRNPGVGEDQQPKLQAKIDIEGTDEAGKKVKMSAPPADAGATQLRGMPGQFGIGSAIPLESFRPGKYTISIKLIDTVSKQNYTLKQDFTVVAAPKA